MKQRHLHPLRLLPLCLLLFLFGCRNQDTIVVGSKNFTESILLGEIVAQQLERHGITVDRKLNLGGSFICHNAQVNGQLDIYVEYTGTDQHDPPRAVTVPQRHRQPEHSESALVAYRYGKHDAGISPSAFFPAGGRDAGVSLQLHLRCSIDARFSPRYESCT